MKGNKWRQYVCACGYDFWSKNVFSDEYLLTSMTCNNCGKCAFVMVVD